MAKHIHIHLTRDAGTGTSETKTKNGVTTWGSSDPKKALDAGTSEGAKKAAETRKRGGGAQTEQSHPRGAAGSKTSGQFTSKPAAENYTKRQTTAKGTTVQHTSAAHSSAYEHHKSQSGKGHAEAAALHQHARHAQQSQNPMFSGRAEEASKRAWAASKSLGYNGR